MSKTCGECQWYDYHHLLCAVGGDVAPTNYACDSFTPIKLTNGDVVRQMSNIDLAEMLVYPVKPMNVNGNIHYEFTSCLLLGKSYPMREQAVFLTEKRLNAPAESKESEGKDE